MGGGASRRQALEARSVAITMRLGRPSCAFEAERAWAAACTQVVRSEWPAAGAARLSRRRTAARSKAGGSAVGGSIPHTTTVAGSSEVSEESVSRASASARSNSVCPSSR